VNQHIQYPNVTVSTGVGFPLYPTRCCR